MGRGRERRQTCKIQAYVMKPLVEPTMVEPARRVSRPRMKPERAKKAAISTGGRIFYICYNRELRRVWLES